MSLNGRARGLLHLKRVKEQVSSYRDRGSPQRLYQQPVVPLRALLSCQAAVILGDPGAGKTTLLRHLVLLVCRGELFPDRVPIFIKLATVNWKAGALRRHLQETYDEFSDFLESALQDGRAVLFLDGLDEVPRSSHQVLADEVVKLAARSNSIYVSSRAAAYPKGLLPSAFQVFNCVDSLSHCQQRRISASNGLAMCPCWALNFERQLVTGGLVARFATNPLMISPRRDAF